MARAVVVGGSGFIGTRFISTLLEQGHRVVNLDIAPSAEHADLTTIGDVRDIGAVTAALQGADVVVNLAAVHRDDVRPLALYESVNVGGARSLVAAAEKAGVEHVVFVSSVAVYGLGRPRPSESDPTEPFNEYGRTKLAAEGVLSAWADAAPGRTLTMLRPCVVFGEGNRGNVWTLASQVASRRFLMIGDGSNRKSMAYVGNIAAFLAHVVQAPPSVRLVNYADRPDLTTAELVGVLSDELGIRLPRVRLPLLAGKAASAVLDGVAKATGRTFPVSAVRVEKFVAETTVDTERLQGLGFTPPFRMDDALRRTVATEFAKA